MFGNLQGWIISAAIAGLVGWLIWAKGTPEPVSKPSGTLPQGLVPITLATDPSKVLPKGSKDCNAGDLYRKAADHYKQNKRKYEAFDKKPGLDNARGLDGIDLLVEAKDCSKMDLFKSKPAEVVNYDNSKPILPELQQLGRIAVQVGAMHGSKKDEQKAREYMEAVFAMGRNLYEERVVFEEYRVGTEAMTNAAGMLANPNFGPDRDDKARVDMLNSFRASVEDYQKNKLTPLWSAIAGIGADKKGQLLFAGDMIHFAQNSKEPMWQTESLLKLGRMQYMKEVKYADQRGSVRILTEYAGKSDLSPNAKTAAIAGRDLERTKFRMYGGGS